MFGLPKLYLYAALVAAVVALGLWLRWDAVRDYRAKLEADRTQHINDARKIENETRNSSDADLIECLSGRRC